jgi:chromosomal replication initiation ATPase DnaA
MCAAAGVQRVFPVRENIGAFDPALIVRPDTVTLAHRILAQRPLDEFTAPTNMIIQVVSTRFHVSVAKLKSPQRAQHTAFVRQIAMYLLRECTDSSFPHIGCLFYRDHSTVIHGCRLIARRMEADSSFARMVESLKRECCVPAMLV